MDYEYDKELIYMIKEGNQSDLEILLEKYDPLIRKIVNKFKRSYTDLLPDTDDLLQEGRILLIDIIKNYKEVNKASFFTYLYKSLCNKMLSLATTSMKKQTILTRRTISIDDDESIIQIADIIDISKNIDSNELITKIIEFKHNLSFENSIIFELKSNGFSYQEIGKMLELSEKKVDNRILKIKQKLKFFLKTYL